MDNFPVSKAASSASICLPSGRFAEMLGDSFSSTLSYVGTLIPHLCFFFIFWINENLGYFSLVCCYSNIKRSYLNMSRKVIHKNMFLQPVNQ